MLDIKNIISLHHDIRKKWYLDMLCISIRPLFPASHMCLFRFSGNEYRRNGIFRLWMFFLRIARSWSLLSNFDVLIMAQILFHFNKYSSHNLLQGEVTSVKYCFIVNVNSCQETAAIFINREKYRKIRIFWRFSGNQTILGHFMVRYWLFILKYLTDLVTMRTVTKETGYFPLYSQIAIFAEYFVCFFDEIEY